jgi:hypothetical protein
VNHSYCISIHLRRIFCLFCYFPEWNLLFENFSLFSKSLSCLELHRVGKIVFEFIRLFVATKLSFRIASRTGNLQMSLHVCKTLANHGKGATTWVV